MIDESVWFVIFSLCAHVGTEALCASCPGFKHFKVLHCLATDEQFYVYVVVIWSQELLRACVFSYTWLASTNQRQLSLGSSAKCSSFLYLKVTLFMLAHISLLLWEQAWHLLVLSERLHLALFTCVGRTASVVLVWLFASRVFTGKDYLEALLNLLCTENGLNKYRCSLSLPFFFFFWHTELLFSVLVIEDFSVCSKSGHITCY